MKQVRLKQLFLRNFKGIRNFLFEPKGNAVVCGDNATGKTTLFDGFCWLLFDKDSQGKAAFEIKSLDKSGTALHNLEHEVEGVLLIDGKPVKLRKVYSEKWTKKRGSATKEHTGHTTEYFIDDVPINMTEYRAKVQEIADEEFFKLLTSPLYFNTQLHWQKRREILLEVCGDITYDDVIESDPELKELSSILEGRRVDDHKKVIAAKKKEVNEELERIPTRIDECERNLPDIRGIDTEKESAVISNLTLQIKEESARLNQIESGGAIAEKWNQVKQLEADMLDIKTKFRKSVNDEIERLETEKREISGKLKGELEVLSINQEITFHQGIITKNQTAMDKLRDFWKQAAEKKFEFEQSSTCPTCGQPLPEDQINAARQKAEADFNIQKSAQLTDINWQGKELKSQCEISKGLITDGQDKLKVIEEKRRELQAKLEMIDKALKPLQNSLDNYQGYADYQELSVKRDHLEKEIIDLQIGKQADTQPIRDKIFQLEQDKAKHNQNIILVQTAEAGYKRIEDLKRQEQALAKEYEKLERELFLIEQFTRAKVNLLESQINSKFKITRWKLFDDQINGGLKECCVALGQNENTGAWVPYDTALNNGGRINCGLDCINTLSSHYGLSFPVFIDNGESITNPIPINSQTIKLVVSEKDKTLRIEASKEETLNEALLTAQSAN